MADLWDRLRAAKDKPSRPKAEPGAAPPGWTLVAPLVAERRFEFPLDARFWRAVGPGLDTEAWEGTLCFDTETTGLSGGAGTLAFLAGWARLLPGDPPSVEIRQWFLKDHPGEPDLIALLDAEFRQARGLVSFNGASYDLPLLRSRWTLSGREFPERPHRDDLHPSRRLWKRLLDSCRLSRLEQTVLGVQRVDDVPGAVVPALWFDYLREGAADDFLTPLEGVFRHHAQDVYSLLCLDLVLAALARDPASERWEETLKPLGTRQSIIRPAPHGLLHPDLAPRTPVDFWGLLALKDEDGAAESLETASSWNNEAVALAWAQNLKRRRDARAADVWTELWSSRSSYPALEELLKWLEHRDKSPEALARALVLIGQGLNAPFLPQAWREALEKRRARLMRLSAAF